MLNIQFGNIIKKGVKKANKSYLSVSKHKNKLNKYFQ